MSGLPLSLRRLDNGTRVPVAQLPFSIGSGPDDDLRLTDPAVRSGHARLREVHGEWLLTARDGCHIQVNGKRVSFMVLGPGDHARIAPGREATELVLEDPMAGVFVPPGTPRWRAWLGHEASRRREAGPVRWLGDRWRPSPHALGGTEELELADGSRVVVRTWRGRPASDPAVEAFLLVLQRLGGVPHPLLAEAIDGGLASADGCALPWLVTRWVPGRPLTDIARAHLSPSRVVGLLCDAAQALAHLHGRGLIHRDVAPSNLILGPDGHVRVIDFGQTILADVEPAEGLGIVGTPGFVAPEEVLHGGAAVTPAVDVYGLAAVGYSLLVGRPPAQGDDLLDTLSRAAKRPPSPRSLGVELPPALEGALLEALDPHPDRRPTMDVFARALDLTRVLVGLA